MCPHTTTYVSSYYYICVLVLLHMCPHTTTYVSSDYNICVLILQHMCLHTTICVLILQYMCPHTTICVLILLYMCPHTSIYVSSYYYICVLVLLYVCPHTTTGSGERCGGDLQPLRMLAYADVCWRMLTYADVQQGLGNVVVATCNPLVSSLLRPDWVYIYICMYIYILYTGERCGGDLQPPSFKLTQARLGKYIYMYVYIYIIYIYT